MLRIRLLHILTLLALLSTLGGCSLPTGLPIGLHPAAPQAAPGATVQPLSTPLPPPPQTLVSFRVLAPANTPVGGLLYLTLVDEVTGLALNPQPIPMEPLPQKAPTDPFAYILTLPAAIGATLTYRYERDLGGVRVAEHLADGSPVRYRMLHVTGQSLVEDVISRWTDTPYPYARGRIVGQAVEAGSGAPLPGLLISAAGMQTFSASDGSFRLEGLPPGTHNLVALALDGGYQTFQQGARVAPDSTTPAQITLQPAPLVSVVFVARVPPGTPPVVPLRMAGNLFDLGNSFGDLSGGMSGVVGNLPVMKSLPDGRYSLTLNLPVGTDLRYKYTLGDGFWNAEHAADGSFRLRQLIVPDHNALIEDSIAAWYAGPGSAEAQPSLTFDVQVPPDTPAGEFVSIQFNPLIGWTQPLPMWPLGNGRWAYVLFSPLNLPGNFSYRYCRNNQCGLADDAQTPGLYGAGRSLTISGQAQTIHDTVKSWQHGSTPAALASAPVIEAAGRGDGFAAGMALTPAYRPSWSGLLPAGLAQAQAMGANWLIFTPTWSYGRTAPGNDPPILAPLAGQDPLWPDLTSALQQAKAAGLKTALFPGPRFAIPQDQWWLSANRADPGWWPVWFDQYRLFILHHADLAAQNGAAGLVLGGDWLAPALPDGVLPDGQPSGAPTDAETRWRGLIAEIRSRYSGQLLWALSDTSILNPPPFLDDLDQVYLALSLEAGQTYEDRLGLGLEAWLEGVAWPVQLTLQKPFLLALEIPAGDAPQAQADRYQEALQAAAGREWIAGVIASGYNPFVRLADPGPNVYGNPAQELLKQWFTQLRAAP